MPFGALLRLHWAVDHARLIPGWRELQDGGQVSVNVTIDAAKAINSDGNMSVLSNIAFDRTFISGPGSGATDAHGFTDLFRALTTSNSTQATLALLAALSKTMATDQHGVASMLSNIAFDKTFISGPGSGTTAAYGFTDLLKALTTSNSIQTALVLLTALSRTMVADQHGVVDANSRTDLQYILDMAQPLAPAAASQHLDITVTHAHDNSSNVTASSTVHVSDILSISITTGALNILTIEMARELLSATRATAACIPTFTLINEHTTIQSSLADALATAYSLVTQHDSQFSRGSLLAATLALTLASGLNASVNIDILLTTDVAGAFGLDYTAGLTAETSLALSRALALSVLAQALAMAGLSAERVVSVSASGSIMSVSVKLPNGRCAIIDADIRVLTVPRRSDVAKI